MTNDEALTLITDLLARHLGRVPSLLPRTARLREDLEVDSLDMLEVLTELEELVEFDFESYDWDASTLEDLARLISESGERRD
jgi:acyl carrier protein